MRVEAVSPILFYDGTCGFCAGSVQFVLARDRRRTLRFGPLQGEAGRALLGRNPELKGVDSVVWLADGVPKMRSDAALAVLEYIGGGWGWAARMARLVPRPLRDATYDLIASRRFRLAARACCLPTLDERARFLA